MDIYIRYNLFSITIFILFRSIDFMTIIFISFMYLINMDIINFLIFRLEIQTCN